jgi:hypothetical protein
VAGVEGKASLQGKQELRRSFLHTPSDSVCVIDDLKRDSTQRVRRHEISQHESLASGNSEDLHCLLCSRRDYDRIKSTPHVHRIYLRHSGEWYGCQYEQREERKQRLHGRPPMPGPVGTMRGTACGTGIIPRLAF